MNDRRTIIRAPALAVALVVALLLLAGTYTVIASPTPVAEVSPAPAAVPAPASPGDASNATSWASGWVAIPINTCQVFTHGLNADPDALAVELLFGDTNDGFGINRRNYGGLEVTGQWFGAYWQHLTDNTIQVCRVADDNVADQVFVRVWVAPTPDYDSEWSNINQGETIQFDHNLGVTATELTVGLWFSCTTRGIHQYAFGGLSVDVPTTRTLGAFWHNLTNSSVQVTRFAGDTAVQQVRVVVLHGDPPTYDSGWRNIGQGSAITLPHNLNLNPNVLLVRGESYNPSAGGLGIHQLWAGGNHHWSAGFQGTHFQNLTNNSITVVRRANDTDCPRVRVRIYAPQFRLYLPLVLNNYGGVPEVELAYDDGIADSEQSQATLGSGFAVLFTTPGTSARLVRARYYLDTAAAGHPIEVHVWNAAHTDLITPFTATPPAGAGWFDVDLSSYNLTVSGDFYVGFLYSVQHSDPSVGVDTTSPDGRSYEVPWEAFANDFMIRAVVQGP